MFNNDIPVVSIRCLVYNQENYIRDCLDGIVMQKTNFKFEAVIHDDVSTDGTVAIIQEYAERYPDIIKPIYETENQFSKKDGSLSRIMNAHTHGKYVALCEGDDYWTDPLKLQKQVDFLEANPDVSMCFHRAKVLYDGNESPLYGSLTQREYSVSEILKRWLVPTCSVMYRREIIPAVPYDKEFCVGDNVLFATCGKFGKLYCLSDEMSVYRQHQGISNGMSYRLLTKYWIAHARQLPEFAETTLGIASFLYAEEVIMLIKRRDAECFSYYSKACKDLGSVKFTLHFIKTIFISTMRNIGRLFGQKKQ